MSELRKAAQAALAFTMRDFATVQNFAAARAVLHDTLQAALAQPEPVNQCGEVCERAKLCAICASDLAEANKRLEALAQPEQDDDDAIIIQYHEETIKRLEKRIVELELVLCQKHFVQTTPAQQEQEP